MDLVKNIILDVDGTLWNTTEVVAAAWNRAIQADGRTKITVDGARLRTLFGKPMDIIGKELFTDVTDDIREELLDSCCYYEQEALKQEEASLLYPNVPETIQRLVKEQGRKLFIVSNCQCGYIELFLEKNQLASYITDFECFGNTGLPKGKNISLLATRNKILASECIYVGDTVGDYEAAKDAGMPFLFAAYGFGAVEGTRQIRDFIELLAE
ncbi:MAG: HAD family hydrolase [Lachnospiraceae bacterium]|nr:HAD family hydrolase [Lachnospiraceae bacterium]